VSSFRDSRIVYVQNEINLGGGGARNKGIEAARSSVVAFQDSDDEWLPRKLEICLKYMDNLGEGVEAVEKL